MRRLLPALLAAALAASAMPASAQEAPASPAPPAEAPAAPAGEAPAASEDPAVATPAQSPAADAAATGEEPTKSDLAYGAFQRGFYLTAREMAEPLAKLGDPAAQTLLGEIYSRGLGVAIDLAEAAKWYKAAAHAGSAEGQFRYALMLLDGRIVGQDLAQARDLMKAAADAGLPLAQYNYGQMLIQASPAGGFEEARNYFERAAKSGVPDAQYAMAQLYEYGKGVPARDEGLARQWLKAAAINGHDTAQIEYGIWLINGKGGEALQREGFLWLKRAAQRGNPIAINRLAHLYKDGVGTEPDKTEAAKWYVLAKRAENTDPVLDDFFRGLDAETQKEALEAANRFRTG